MQMVSQQPMHNSVTAADSLQHMIPRKDFVKLMYHGNDNIVGRKKNQLQIAIDYWRSYNTGSTYKNAGDHENRLNEILGLFKDKVPSFDVRRLQNLRSMLLKVADSQMRVQCTDNIWFKAEKVLGSSSGDLARSIILDFLLDRSTNTIIIEKLDLLIKKFEMSGYQYHQHGVNHLVPDRPIGLKSVDRVLQMPVRGGGQHIQSLLTFLGTTFELKFKNGMREAFAHFIQNGTTQISLQGWRNGI